jgi:SAM-dependent methyltransferase
MLSAPLCPACESAAHEFFTEHEGMTLYRCRGCATVYLHPMPDEAALAALYTDAYDGALSGYFSKVDKKLRRSRMRMKRLARRIPGGQFLDVGCNGGFMVEAARERGFDAHGIELDPVSVRYAREHYPKNGYFEGRIEDYAPDAPFDLIYSSEVIEHVPEVSGFVAAIARLLKPGGHLYVTTPDISHWRRPRRLTDWDGFCPPSHCIFFTPSSLKALLTRHGLETVQTGFAWKPGIKILARRTG